MCIRDRAYDELNTEKFRSERHYRSQVWACCKAAVYLYGAADAGQVETICKAVGCEADAGAVSYTHLDVYKRQAYKKVKSNKGKGGIDGMQVDELLPLSLIHI